MISPIHGSKKMMQSQAMAAAGRRFRVTTKGMTMRMTHSETMKRMETSFAASCTATPLTRDPSASVAFTIPWGRRNR